MSSSGNNRRLSNMSVELLVKKLRRNYLFAILTDAQMQRILQSMRVITLGVNETLFTSQHRAERFFLLDKGMIKLSRLSARGMEKVMEIVQPGEVFATAVMFMAIPHYPVSANAVRASEILAIDNATYLEILRESPDACFRVMGDMSRRLRCKVNQIDNLCLQSATYRLVRYLLEHLEGQEPRTDQVVLLAPKHVIASSLSIQPETFSRILHLLSKKELIMVDKRVIRIPCEADLQDYADSCESCRTRDT